MDATNGINSMKCNQVNVTKWMMQPIEGIQMNGAKPMQPSKCNQLNASKWMQTHEYKMAISEWHIVNGSKLLHLRK